MMGKFRKKPIIIEARLLNYQTLNDVLEWCEGSYESNDLDLIVDGIIIETLEGDMRASIGDYIIKGVNGEFYPCKPEIFHKTYEEVND